MTWELIQFLFKKNVATFASSVVGVVVVDVVVGGGDGVLVFKKKIVCHSSGIPPSIYCRYHFCEPDVELD